MTSETYFFNDTNTSNAILFRSIKNGQYGLSIVNEYDGIRQEYVIESSPNDFLEFARFIQQYFQTQQ
jgi:hypothetical protein